MRLRLLILFTLAFTLLYASADLITSLHSWRWPIAPPSWPFWAGWESCYLSLNLLIPLAFWRLPQRKLGPFTAALLMATAVAWPLFVLFPLPGIAAPPQATSAAFEFADALNLDSNMFPSLHVTYALLCAAFLGRWWGWLWGVAICWSTLVTHQHYTIDVAGGVGLALLAFYWARGRGRIEGICLGEVARCAARHRRYALIGVGLFAASLGRWRRRRLARLGFCYLQHLDDLLDGQLSSEVEPLEVASSHQAALRGEREFSEESDLELMGAAFLSELRVRGEGLEWAVEVIEEMKLDRRRVVEGILLEEAELDRHLERTFELSLNLMLLAADSSLRASQAPHLLSALGWCSVVRDYAEDQSLGLVNVPEGPWREGKVEEWFERRYLQVKRHLQRAELELAALKGQNGHRLLALFCSSVKGYARREGARREGRNSPE